MKSKIWSLSTFLVLFTIIPSLAWGWSGRVVDVATGETITVLRNGKNEKVMLYGIDCPEDGQPFSNEAKQFTSEMVFGKKVQVEQIREDRQGRIVAIVAVEKRLLNEEIVKAGFGWVYNRYCDWPICETWKALQLKAKLSNRGLWIDPSPVPPWEFRRKEKRD